MNSLSKKITFIHTICYQKICVRNLYSYKPRSVKELGPRPSKKLKAQSECIKARGFLRNIRAYQPPRDVTDQVHSLCTQAGMSTESDTPLSDPVIRFNILKDCFAQLNHAVPNSQLHTINTVGDMVTFYNTPVETTTPLEALKSMDLPKNIHVQHEYHRFHPDTDTMFNGVSAFPKSSTLVTGLLTKKKYKGYNVEPLWYNLSKKFK